jgi:hypothetical protein
MLNLISVKVMLLLIFMLAILFLLRRPDAVMADVKQHFASFGVRSGELTIVIEKSSFRRLWRWLFSRCIATGALRKKGSG